MIECLQISDHANGTLTVDLAGILRVLRSHSCLEKFAWHILELEARGDLSQLGTTMLALEDRIAESPHGVVLTWTELQAFATAVEQVIDIVVCGSIGSHVPVSLTPSHLYRSEFVLECIDSSYWLVFSKNRRVLEAIQSQFKETSFVSRAL